MLTYGTAAFIAALAATLLAIAAIAEFLGYLSSSLVGGLTPTELGVFAFLAIGVAIGCNIKSDEPDYGSSGSIF